MKDKKHIDELLKDQLQHFEAAPSPEVWSNIQAKLQKKEEDRKVIPIWWKWAGVAALLALLLTSGNYFLDPFGTDASNTIVQEDKQNADNDLLDSTDDNKESILVDNSSQVASESSVDEDALKTDVQEGATPEKVDFKETIGSKDKTNAIATTKNQTTYDSSNKISEEKTQIKRADNTVSKVKEAVATNQKTVSEKLQNTSKDLKDVGIAKIEEKQDALVKDKVSKISDTEINKSTAVAIEMEAKDISEEKSEKETSEKKKSIFDAIEEDKEAAVAKIEVDDSTRDWEVTPNFGPVFYNSLSGGSSIDPSFADNSQNGDVNFSYGVQVSYAISDRVSVRSGVSNVNLGYTTGGVELASGPVAVALRSIDYGGQNTVLSAFDRGTLGNLPPPSDGNPFSNLNPKSTSGNAELIQNLSYYEVPLELHYALFNKRFGMNVIGGFSTLFLGNNEVSVRDGDFQQVLGEANNLNATSFTTNVGLGFNYKISKRLKFNIEPMFKYQLNPYTDSSVDFRPYYLGVYSGLSFKF